MSSPIPASPVPPVVSAFARGTSSSLDLDTILRRRHAFVQQVKRRRRHMRSRAASASTHADRPAASDTAMGLSDGAPQAGRRRATTVSAYAPMSAVSTARPPAPADGSSSPSSSPSTIRLSDLLPRREPSVAVRLPGNGSPSTPRPDDSSFPRSAPRPGAAGITCPSGSSTVTVPIVQQVQYVHANLPGSAPPGGGPPQLALPPLPVPSRPRHPSRPQVPTDPATESTHGAKDLQKTTDALKGAQHKDRAETEEDKCSELSPEDAASFSPPQRHLPLPVLPLNMGPVSEATRDLMELALSPSLRPSARTQSALDALERSMAALHPLPRRPAASLLATAHAPMPVTLPMASSMPMIGKRGRPRARTVGSAPALPPLPEVGELERKSITSVAAVPHTASGGKTTVAPLVLPSATIHLPPLPPPRIPLPPVPVSQPSVPDPQLSPALPTRQWTTRSTGRARGATISHPPRTTAATIRLADPPSGLTMRYGDLSLRLDPESSEAPHSTFLVHK